MDLLPISLAHRLLTHRLRRLPSWGHTEDGSANGGEEACIKDPALITFAMPHRSAKNFSGEEFDPLLHGALEAGRLLVKKVRFEEDGTARATRRWKRSFSLSPR